jgi:uncharacterized protein with HEPN domain
MSVPPADPHLSDIIEAIERVRQALGDTHNVLRHNYENISAPLMWKLVKENLPDLERACREELARI